MKHLIMGLRRVNIGRRKLESEDRGCKALNLPATY
jgi:hypothetical protein